MVTFQKLSTILKFKKSLRGRVALNKQDSDFLWGKKKKKAVGAVGTKKKPVSSLPFLKFSQEM